MVSVSCVPALVLKPKDRDIQLSLDIAMRQQSGSQSSHCVLARDRTLLFE